MIGKIFGAIAGNQAAKHIPGLNGTGGVLLGVAAPTLLRRMGPFGLIAVAVGGYAYKKYDERREANKLKAPTLTGVGEPTRTQA
ncbi:hypothetical protein [Novosphingobium sp. AP12]|uniref:hypothetical protein n=1 Tax=Novosphingobium sp. AP12 TaxID=1144305 RepID=UPI000272247D|nr:hypothetical protein [Novosphingobium sp. AP12]EJL22018.1 hypothetical protein PMI02_04804 [Novosphingobium sp. AP12]